MTNRFLISVAAAALIAGTGFANAQGMSRARGLGVTPDLVDQLRDADALPDVEGENGEECSLPGTPNVERAAVAHDLERAEHPELHAANGPTRIARINKACGREP